MRFRLVLTSFRRNIASWKSVSNKSQNDLISHTNTASLCIFQHVINHIWIPSCSRIYLITHFSCDEISVNCIRMIFFRSCIPVEYLGQCCISFPTWTNKTVPIYSFTSITCIPVWKVYVLDWSRLYFQVDIIVFNMRTV